MSDELDKTPTRLVHDGGAIVVVPAHEAGALVGHGFREAEPASDEAPRGNASRDEWAAYATTLGIDVPEDAKRDDVKALVAAHLPE